MLLDRWKSWHAQAASPHGKVASGPLERAELKCGTLGNTGQGTTASHLGALATLANTGADLAARQQAVAAGLLDRHIACPMPVTIGWELLV